MIETRRCWGGDNTKRAPSVTTIINARRRSTIETADFELESAGTPIVSTVANTLKYVGRNLSIWRITLDRGLSYQLGLVLALAVAYYVVIYINSGPLIVINERPSDLPLPKSVPFAFEVDIALIGSSKSEMKGFEALKEIIENDIRDYLISENLDDVHSFNIYVDSILYPSEDIIGRLGGFKAIAVRFLVGGLNARQLDGIFPYIQRQDMLLISPMATINRSDGPSSHFLSLMSNESLRIDKIGKAIIQAGLRTIIVLESDSKVDQLSQRVLDSFVDHGGKIYARMNSSAPLSEIESKVAEALENSSYRELFILELHSLEKTRDLRGHPLLSNATWMTFEKPVSYHASWWDEYGDGFSIKTLQPIFGGTPIEESVSSRYSKKVGNKLSFEMGNAYDACMIMVLSFIETEQYDVDPNIEQIFRIAYRYEGVTGNCTLNRYGDRANMQYEVVDIINKTG